MPPNPPCFAFPDRCAGRLGRAALVLLAAILFVVWPCAFARAQGQPKSLGLKNVRSQDEVQHEERWAVIVGIGQYAYCRPLNFPVNDAREMVSTLQVHCGFPRDHILLLTDKEATVQKVRNALGTWLLLRARPLDTVVIYFSGHGTPDIDPNVAEGGAQTYIVCHDTDPNDLASTAYTMDDLRVALGRIRSERTLVLLDSCYSGAAPAVSTDASVRTVPRPGVKPETLTDAPFNALAKEGRGRIVLTASAANEPSYEYGSLQHGLFTYYLLLGLSGKAAQHGKLTPSALSEYVRERVANPGAGLHPQHPIGFTALSGADFNLVGAAVNPGGKGSLSLLSSPLGAQVVVDGKSMGKTPLPPLPLEEGSHQVVMLKTGFLPYTNEVFVSSGGTTYESGVLRETPNTGDLLIVGPPGASIRIDDHDKGIVSGDGFLLLNGLDAKSVTLKVEAPDFRPYAEQIAINAGTMTTRSVTLVKNLRGVRSPTPNDRPDGLTQTGTQCLWKRDGSEMVFVSEGPFVMGADKADAGAADLDANTRPKHEVSLPAFWIDRTEVTNAQFARFVRDANYAPQGNWTQPPASKSNYPVVNVTLEDARAYAKWAGKRLPTEEEWEKAARSTDGRLYPYGMTYQETYQFTHASTTLDEPTRIGLFPNGASPYGVLDMLGNVAEWCDTPYDVYPNGVRDDKAYGNGSYVVRGGSFRTHPLSEHLTVVLRLHLPPTLRQPDIGFRCVVTAK